ncbi:FAR1 DNA binding domain-containing protein [Tanacetum coccineum]
MYSDEKVDTVCCVEAEPREGAAKLSHDSDEFRPTPNSTPYWVPDVPEDENPRKVFSLTILMIYLKCTSYVECNRAGKPRRAKEVNTLNEVDGEDGEIPEKLPRKVLGDLAADTKFRKDFHKLVWNVYIGPEVFEKRWDDMITRYNLHDNKWLSDMYAIRERWVPGYFKEVPMCGLMKTTSPSESSNSFFQTALPAYLLDKRHRYGPCIEETDTLASQFHQTIKDCISIFRNDTDKLSELLSTVKESIFRSKGTKGMKSAAEIGKAKTIARTNRKVPFKRCTCNACGGKGHNKATCKGCSACGEAGHHKGICKRFLNQDKDEVVDEDKGDNEEEVDDE